MNSSLQIHSLILVAVIALRLMAAPPYLAWAMTAPWPLSTITVPVTGLMQLARTDGGWRFQSREQEQVEINFRGGLRLAPPGKHKVSRPV